MNNLRKARIAGIKNSRAFFLTDEAAAKFSRRLTLLGIIHTIANGQTAGGIVIYIEA